MYKPRGFGTLNGRQKPEIQNLCSVHDKSESVLMKSLFMIMPLDLVMHNRNLIEQRHEHKYEI